MSTGPVIAPHISTELLLEVFDLPVTFYRCLVPITGGVTAALMLSQAITITQEIDAAANGWFSKSKEQWTEDTGLSRWEQATARRTLRAAGFLEERRIGMPSRLWYRVCPDRVWHAMKKRADSRGAHRTQECS